MIEAIKEAGLVIMCTLISPLVSFPIIAALVIACNQWENLNTDQSTCYPLWKRWQLAIPLVVIVEMVLLAVGSQHPARYRLDTSNMACSEKVTLLFLSVLPVMGGLIFRLRRCWRFALWTCLAQFWLAITVWIALWFTYFHL